jgi:peroxiredoxin
MFTVLWATSGLHGIMACKGAPPADHVRQLKLGLHALSNKATPSPHPKALHRRLPHNRAACAGTFVPVFGSVFIIVVASTMTPSAPLNVARRQACLSAITVAGLSGLGLTACSGQNSAPQAEYLLIDGTRMSSQALEGKVSLINFWATTCISCVKEMPTLIETHQKFKDRGFETVAVAMSYDQPAWVLNFAQSRQLPFKVALDHTGNIAKVWGDIKLTPTTFIVDRQGRIVKRYVGEPDFQALHQLLDRLLTSA